MSQINAHAKSVGNGVEGELNPDVNVGDGKQQDVDVRSGSASGTPGFNIDPDELLKLLEHLDTSSTDAHQRDPYGKDGKPSVGGTFSEEFTSMEVAVLLARVQETMQKANEQNIKTGMQGVEIADKQTEASNAARQKKLEEWIDKQAEEGKASRGPFGWFMSFLKLIAAVVAAVVAVAITIVFPNPLTAALAVLAIGGAVAAAVEIVGKISEAAGGPSFTLATILPKLFTAIFMACGMSRKDAEKYGNLIGGSLSLPFALVDQSGLEGYITAVLQVAGVPDSEIKKIVPWLVMAITILIAIATIALAIASGNVTQTAGTISQALGVAQKISTALGAVTGIASGSQQIYIGVKQHDVLMTQADLKELETLLDYANQNRDVVMKKLQEGMKLVADFVQRWSDMLQTMFGAEGKSIRRMA